MNYAALSGRIQDHVVTFFSKHKNPFFIYHNLGHTQSVVKAATQIGNHYQLSERDFFVVTSAAWFHDIGYHVDMSNHEARGADLAAAYLRENGLDEPIITDVMGCILATRLPQSPKTLLEEIVCDADLFHLGTEEFADNNKLMRKETEARQGKEISKEDWRGSTIRLFEQHHYFTDYCQLLLNDQKQAHLDKLRRKTADKTKKKQLPATAPQPAAATATAPTGVTLLTPPGRKKKDERYRRPDRSIETMFRITSANNQRLSDMADNKAHIMITVNSIILSAIISLLLRKLDEYDFLKIPTFITLAVSVATIIFSILATRPKIPAGKFTQEDLQQKKVNLLFFGNYYRMSFEDYTSGMIQVMNDREFLYSNLTRDAYSQGVVLGRKFRLLRISYNIFMYGLILSVLAFVIATIFFSGQPA